MLENIKKANTDISGLITVLADNLYSTPEVAIRELIQNAHDAVNRGRIEGHVIDNPRIDVRIIERENIIEFADNGSGLTREEIDEFLATIARGYTRKLRTEHQDNHLIGFFGLGFLSTYVITDKVEVITCSYQTPDETLYFTSRNAETYSVAEGPARPIGTTVRLHLSDAYMHLLEYGELYRILKHYCPLLDVPIHLNESPNCINNVSPPWENSFDNAIRYQKELMEFCKEMSRGFSPLYAIPIPEGSSVSGVLWIHSASTYGTSDNRNLSVYLRGMLLTGSDRDLLPEWAGFVSGVINSTTLTPTASRESLKKDRIYDQVKQDIKNALLNGLKDLPGANSEAWKQVLVRHNEALRGAALADHELFQTLRNKIKLPTSKGEYTVSELQERSEGKIYVCLGDQGSAEEVLFAALNVPIVKGYLYAAAEFCRRYRDVTGLPIVILGSSGDEDRLFKIEDNAELSARLFPLLIDSEKEEGFLAAFQPEFMPIIKIPNREAILKHELEADEASHRMSHAVLSLARETASKIGEDRFLKVYINLSSPIIQTIQNLPPTQQKKFAALILAFSDIPLSNEALPVTLDKTPYQSFYNNLLDLMTNEEVEQ